VIERGAWEAAVSHVCFDAAAELETVVTCGRV